MSTTSDWIENMPHPSIRGCRWDRPNPSELECYGMGFVGSQGASTVLSQLDSTHSALNVANNNLMTAGLTHLVEGLDEYRRKFATVEDDDWGLTTLDISHCNVTDEGLEVMMAYAVRETKLRYFQARLNLIQLKTNFGYIAETLNASHITRLDLSHNRNLLSSSVSQLFTLLDAPHLSLLDLSSSSLNSEIAAPIASYLRSTRSRSLRSFELRNNNLDLRAVRDIIDALEFGNFTLRELDVRPDLRLSAISGYQPNSREGSSPFDNLHLVTELEVASARIRPLRERNWMLGARAQKAALRCLPIARILFNAKPPLHLSQLPFPIDFPFPSSISRFLNLPTEIQHIVIRHTSGDAGALSNAQFAHLRVKFH